MGMFDTIGEELFCPFCGKKQEKDSFQTKDLSSMASSWTIEEIRKCCDKREIVEIYTECENCKKWISINLQVWRMLARKSHKIGGAK